jgi:hypothetical protein
MQEVKIPKYAKLKFDELPKDADIGLYYYLILENFWVRFNGVDWVQTKISIEQEMNLMRNNAHYVVVE